MGYQNISKSLVGALVAALIFSVLISPIVSALTTAALNLSGAAATIVGTTLTILISVGFMVGMCKMFKLV